MRGWRLTQPDSDTGKPGCQSAILTVNSVMLVLKHRSIVRWIVLHHRTAVLVSILSLAPQCLQPFINNKHMLLDILLGIIWINDIDVQKFVVDYLHDLKVARDRRFVAAACT